MMLHWKSNSIQNTTVMTTEPFKYEILFRCVRRREEEEGDEEEGSGVRLGGERSETSVRRTRRTRRRRDE
jgi:hypothetical protein